MGRSIELVPGVIANDIVGAIGDGCLIRTLSEDGMTLTTVAVDHRDAETRGRLGERLHGGALACSQAGWSSEALAKNVPFTLTGPAAEQAVTGRVVNAADDLDGLVDTSVLAPLLANGQTVGVVTAFRGAGAAPYTLREQLLIGEIAAGIHHSGPATSDERVDSFTLLEQTANALWTTDLDGRTTYANARAASLVGVPTAALLGHSMQRFLGPRWRASPARLSAWAGETEEELRRADGETRWISLTSAPLTDARGRRCGTVHSAVDVTDRRRREGSLRMALAAHQAIGDLVDQARLESSSRPFLRKTTAMVAEHLGAEFATVSAVEGGQHVIPRTAVGWDTKMLGRVVPFSTRSATGLCLDDDHPYAVTDYESVEGVEMGELARRAEARSAVCIGIGAGLGVLGVVSPRPNAFSEHDLSFLRTVSWLLASRWTEAPQRLRAV